MGYGNTVFVASDQEGLYFITDILDLCSKQYELVSRSWTQIFEIESSVCIRETTRVNYEKD